MIRTIRIRALLGSPIHEETLKYATAVLIGCVAVENRY